MKKMAVVALLFLGGCAIAPKEGGQGYVLGVGMSGTGSAEQAGGFVQGILGAVGMPGQVAAGIGGLFTLGLGALGIGHYRGKAKGVDQGYDEKAKEEEKARLREEAEFYAGRAEKAPERGTNV